MKILHLVLDGPSERSMCIPYSAVHTIEWCKEGCIVNGFECRKPAYAEVVAMLEEEK